ncbi:hypothetical protein CCACVL1_29808 [Corchorus capsularis]|uniref:Uncharacterized protein n=1 Tax=Corchorus capsularis TaxID=210143 RepID=A0A1R3G030_COCAP|nr:hypothetical protein CCACVL1_29808 [Corchorus capsularis]
MKWKAISFIKSTQQMSDSLLLLKRKKAA